MPAYPTIVSRCAESDDLMINKRYLLKVALITTIAMCSLACSQRSTDEDKISKIIKKVQHAAEEKDIRSILSRVSRTYRDPEGNDYNSMRDLLLLYFYQYPKISVYITDLNVSADASSATAKFQAALTGRGSGGAAGGILPEALGIYRFEVQFAPEQDEWKIVSATWSRMGDVPSEK